MPAREAENASLQPDGQAFLRNLAAAKIKGGMEKQLSPRLKGSNAVRVEVHVKELTVVPIRQRAFGGEHTMTVEVTVVDLRTKSVLLSYPERNIRVPVGKGLAGALLDVAVMPDPSSSWRRILLGNLPNGSSLRTRRRSGAYPTYFAKKSSVRSRASLWAAG
jgi:hypothetical protein